MHKPRRKRKKRPILRAMISRLFGTAPVAVEPHTFGTFSELAGIANPSARKTKGFQVT